MEMNVYREHVKQQGSASVATIYLSKVPDKYVLHVEHLAATIYTTTIGSYGTQKYMLLGFELGGNKHILYGGRVNAGYGPNPLVVREKDFTIPAGARLFAYFEDTSTSETYEVAATGIFHKKEEE